MTWINPLDKLPQVPVDWANHVIYGGAAGIALMLLGASADSATWALLGVGGLKKAIDFVKEGESLSMCVGKTLAGAIWPASFLLF